VFPYYIKIFSEEVDDLNRLVFCLLEGFVDLATSLKNSAASMSPSRSVATLQMRSFSKSGHIIPNALKASVTRKQNAQNYVPSNFRFSAEPKIAWHTCSCACSHTSLASQLYITHAPVTVPGAINQDN